MATKAKSAAKTPSTPAAVLAKPEALAKKPAKTQALKEPKPFPGTIQTTVGPKGGKLVEPSEDKHEVTDEQRHAERRQSSTIAQFVDTSLKTPAVHSPALTEQQQKQKDFNEAALALAKEMGVDPGTVATIAKATKVSTRVVKNNITRPATGTETGKVWDAADAITTTQRGQAAQISQVREHQLTHGMNEHTIKTQFARWRAFHGVHGRAVVVKVAAQPATQGAYDGMPVFN